jgi:hypothetical protein
VTRKVTPTVPLTIKAAKLQHLNMGLSRHHCLLVVFLIFSLSCVCVRPDVFDLNEVSEASEADRLKRQISPYLYQQFQDQRTDPQYDRRAEESWWQMYGYGERFMDDKLIPMRNREFQINLGFDFPYYGFRFNYTQINPGGFISFAMPNFNQPPFTFPNPRWPSDRDHSFIAPFYADATFQFIGEKQISNVWFRTIHRPKVSDDLVEQSRNELIASLAPLHCSWTAPTISLAHWTTRSIGLSPATEVGRVALSRVNSRNRDVRRDKCPVAAKKSVSRLDE